MRFDASKNPTSRDARAAGSSSTENDNRLLKSYSKTVRLHAVCFRLGSLASIINAAFSSLCDASAKMPKNMLHPEVLQTVAPKKANQ